MLKENSCSVGVWSAFFLFPFRNLIVLKVEKVSPLLSLPVQLENIAPWCDSIESSCYHSFLIILPDKRNTYICYPAIAQSFLLLQTVSNSKAETFHLCSNHNKRKQPSPCFTLQSTFYTAPKGVNNVNSRSIMLLRNVALPFSPSLFFFSLLPHSADQNRPHGPRPTTKAE